MGHSDGNPGHRRQFWGQILLHYQPRVPHLPASAPRRPWALCMGQLPAPSCSRSTAVAWGGPARDNLGEGSRWSSLSRSPRPSPWHRDGHLTGGAGVGTTAQPRPLTPDPPPRPGLFMVMFSLISMDFFQLEAAQAGYLMSFFGVLQMVSGCWAHRVGGGSALHALWAPCPPRVLWAVGLCWGPRTSQTTGTRFLRSAGAVLHARLSGVASTP